VAETYTEFTFININMKNIIFGSFQRLQWGVELIDYRISKT